MFKRGAYISFLIIIFILFSESVSSKIISRKKQIRDPLTQEIIDTYEKGNRKSIESLIKDLNPIIFEKIVSLSGEGLKNVINGIDGSLYFDDAEKISKIYSEIHGKSSLVELVNIYRSYDIKNINIMNQGYQYLSYGQELYKGGQTEEGLIKINEALKIFHDISDFVGEASTLSTLGDISYFSGLHYEALMYFLESLAIEKSINDFVSESKSLKSIGIIYSEQNQFQESLGYFQKAREIDREIGDRAGEALSLWSLGDVNFNLSHYNESLKAFQECLKITQKIGERLGEAEAHLGIGNVYLALSQYLVSMKHYEQSLAISRSIENHEGESSSLGSIGRVYFVIGQYSKALEYFYQALGISVGVDDWKNGVSTLNNIAKLYVKLGKYENALEYAQTTLNTYQEKGDYIGQASSLSLLAFIYNNLNNTKEALEYYKKSLAIYKEVGSSSDEAVTLGNVGYLYERLQLYSESIDSFNMSKSLSEITGDVDTLWRSFHGLGLVTWKSGQPTEAVFHYARAINIIEGIYSHSSGFKEEERFSLIWEKNYVYEEFIQLLLELHHKYPKKGYDRQAFFVSEQAKSRVFQEMLAKAGARAKFTGEANFLTMIKREQHLSGQLINLRQHLNQELLKPETSRSSEVVRSIKDQILKVEQSLRAHINQLDQKYPRYADLKRPRPLQVEDLQAVLADNETVLSYSVGKESLVAFSIGNNSFQLTEIDLGRDALRDRVKTFRQGISSSGDTGFDPLQAHEFYKKIFAPIIPALSDQTKIYISADDVLYTIPFEALVDQPVDTGRFLAQRAKWNRGEAAMHSEFGLLHYLVDSYTLTYLPSASVLRSLRSYEKPGYGKWTTPLIAFADPVFGEDDTDASGGGLSKRGITRITEISLEQLAQSTGTARLNRLRQTAEEALSIRDIVGGSKKDIYLRQNASEENVYNAELKRARFVLFATHGFLGGEFEGMAEPVLALSLVGNSDERDGLLSMSEVLGLDLNAEMVALSACNTSGEGERAGQGEGFAGLTRSFMYAGAKSLLVTHWSVESSAARDLMVDTFKKMKLMSKSAALRAAKLNMKSSTRTVGDERLSQSNPYFWAPFVLVGEGG